MPDGCDDIPEDYGADKGGETHAVYEKGSKNSHAEAYFIDIAKFPAGFVGRPRLA